jgi:hypothetical protein
MLEIKRDKIRDPAKLRNVHAELESLRAARDIGQLTEISRLTAELKPINERLWQVEDEIRRFEQGKDFGPRFIELARSVYRQNDRRSALKRRINEILGTCIVEEKSYASSEAGSCACKK